MTESIWVVRLKPQHYGVAIDTLDLIDWLRGHANGRWHLSVDEDDDIFTFADKADAIGFAEVMFGQFAGEYVVEARNWLATDE